MDKHLLVNKIKLNQRDIMKEFKIKQRDFERKLEFNNTSDPLNLWYHHITWIWDNSEIVDKEQKLLINLIEKCIEKFASDSKYKNDIRFYAIFYKYAQITSDPDEVYDSISCLLFDKISKFYISWSWVLVNLANEEKALEILNLGIEKKAEPINLLIKAKEELEQKIKEKKLYTPNEQQLDSQQRQSILKERKRLSIAIESSSTRTSFANRLSLSSKSLKATTPKENLLIKSTMNRQGFEILEEDSEENRQDSSNEQQVVQQKVSNALRPQIIIHEDAEEALDKQATAFNQLAKEPIKEEDEDDEDVKCSKVKQTNLIEKLKTLEDYKEPKIAIFENLKQNQKFYADLKRIYAEETTEYSFEEIRMRKMKKTKKRKESQLNSDLVKEIEVLKAKIKANEKRDKEKESLQNQVDILKKQIEMIIQASTATTTTQNSKRYLDEVDCIDIDKSKKLKLSENKKFTRTKLRELNTTFTSKTNVTANSNKKEEREELTIVRDMWNGTVASQYSPAVKDLNNQTELANKDQTSANKNQRKEQFSIFKDPTQSNLTKTNDFEERHFSYYPQMFSTTATQALQDCFTIALPHDPSGI